MIFLYLMGSKGYRDSSPAAIVIIDLLGPFPDDVIHHLFSI